MSCEDRDVADGGKTSMHRRGRGVLVLLNEGKVKWREQDEEQRGRARQEARAATHRREQEGTGKSPVMSFDEKTERRRRRREAGNDNRDERGRRRRGAEEEAERESKEKERGAYGKLRFARFSPTIPSTAPLRRPKRLDTAPPYQACSLLSLRAPALEPIEQTMRERGDFERENGTPQRRRRTSVNGAGTSAARRPHGGRTPSLLLSLPRHSFLPSIDSNLSLVASARSPQRPVVLCSPRDGCLGRHGVLDVYRSPCSKRGRREAIRKDGCTTGRRRFRRLSTRRKTSREVGYLMRECWGGGRAGDGGRGEREFREEEKDAAHPRQMFRLTALYLQCTPPTTRQA